MPVTLFFDCPNVKKRVVRSITLLAVGRGRPYLTSTLGVDYVRSSTRHTQASSRQRRLVHAGARELRVCQRSIYRDCRSPRHVGRVVCGRSTREKSAAEALSRNFWTVLWRRNNNQKEMDMHVFERRFSREASPTGFSSTYLTKGLLFGAGPSVPLACREERVG